LELSEVTDIIGERKVVMEMTGRKTRALDYAGLLELAKSRRVKVIDAQGLGQRSGVSFNKAGSEWIAIDSSLPLSERTRALGFLLEHYPGKMRCTQTDAAGVPLGSGETHFQEISCASS
jgi:hypothetical protein